MNEGSLGSELYMGVGSVRAMLMNFAVLDEINAIINGISEVHNDDL